MSTTIPDQTMADRLRHARERRGYESAVAAAARFSLVANTYVQHENGTRGFTHRAVDYARFYRVNLDWLLTGSGDSGLPSAEMGVVSKIEVQSVVLQQVLSFVLRSEDVPRDRAELAASICVEALAKPPSASLGNDPVLSFRVRYEDALKNGSDAQAPK